MKKKLKEIPKFANEGDEREFWLSHDTTDYVDWSKAKRVTFPKCEAPAGFSRAGRLNQ